MSRMRRQRRDQKRQQTYQQRVAEKAQAALASGKIQKGLAHHVCIFHEENCSLLARRGPCDCDFDVGPITREPPSGPTLGRGL